MAVTGGAAETSSPFGSLTPFEQRFAERQFELWKQRLDAKEAGNDERNRSRALNLAYIGVAQLWLAFAAPVAFVAAAFWSFSHSGWQIAIAALLTLAAIALAGQMARRWSQSRQFWSAKVTP